MAEATGMRNNALPYPVYGVPWAVTFPILDADGDLVTGAASLDSEVSKNGDTFADCTNEATEIATSSGVYYLLLTAAEMTADIVTVIVKTGTAGAKTTTLVFYPRKLVTLASGTSQGGAAGYITLAASTVLFNGQYDGCLCVATIDTLIEARVLQVCTSSNQQCTVTPSWNVTPDSDDTYVIYLPEGRSIQSVNAVALSNDLTAADNAESFFDGTGYAGTGNTIPTVTTVTNGVTLANGSHGGAAAVLTLERIVVTATTSNEPAVKMTGNGTGSGLLCVSNNNAITASGGGYGLAVAGTTAAAFFSGMTTGVIVGSGGIGMRIYGGNDVALEIEAGTNSDAVSLVTSNGHGVGGTIVGSGKHLISTLGTPLNLGGGATIASNLADIESQTDDIGAAGAGLTAIPDPLVSTSGTATAGGASSITLQNNAVSGTDYYKNQAIMLTGGTGAGQTNRITAQSGLVCTVQTAWVTQPDNTTTYKVLGRVE